MKRASAIIIFLSFCINTSVLANEKRNHFGIFYTPRFDYFSSKETEVKDWFSDKADNKSGIQIYPNPNDGSFIIDFGSDSFSEYRLLLTNIEGKPVISINEITSSSINIVIKDYPKGVYILYLFNDKNKDIFTHKIIYQ